MKSINAINISMGRHYHGDAIVWKNARCRVVETYRQPRLTEATPVKFQRPQHVITVGRINWDLTRIDPLNFCSAIRHHETVGRGDPGFAERAIPSKLRQLRRWRGCRKPNVINTPI